jgi:7,8-dihydropterin-6-yl-methyl-4-(beta-D-ribofuranosyl)aminobenzene 5'-phosphate synthase
LVDVNLENTKKLNITQADQVEIFSLVDNTIDVLSTPENEVAKTYRQWTKERYEQDWHKTHTLLPYAEHGFAMLIKIFSTTNKIFTVLFDTGVSSNGLIDNTARMGLNLSEVDFLVLSHGHYDHFGGLPNTIKAINKPDLPLIIHKDMLNQRGSSHKGSIRAHAAFPSSEQLTPAVLVKTESPILIADGTLCITGEIPRLTNFETGASSNVVLKNGVWETEPIIVDERALVFNFQEKGLIVISGCAHAGIINTINYAIELTGIKQIYAVMGGFHLAGKENQNNIEPTIEQLKRLNPQIIVPSHCTGWRAISSLEQNLPGKIVHNSVGNLYHFS